MKYIKLIVITFFITTNTLFSQNITAEVQYEISYWQCTKCLLTGKIKELHSIIKISDYKYLPHIYFTALEGKASYGCIKQTSCSAGGSHKNVESDSPTYEKQFLNNISKSRYNGQWIDFDRLLEVTKKINPDYLKWKKLYDAELVRKEAEQKKIEQEIAKKNEQEKKIKEIEFQKNALKLDSLLGKNKFSEAYYFLFEKFKLDPLTIETWNSNSTYSKMNNFFDAVARGEIKKEGNVDICSYGRCDKFSECGSCRQFDANFCKGHNEQFQKMSFSNKLYNKWNDKLINYINGLLDQKLLKDAQGAIDFYTTKEKYINKQEENNQINNWNERIAVLAFENEVKPKLPSELSSNEKILIGLWDSKSKNIKLEGEKSYLIDVIRFNVDRTFFWLLEEHNGVDNSKKSKLEKTGYWKFENNKITFYVDFEADDKNKVRVNRFEVVDISDFSEIGFNKTLEIGTYKILMKGTKRKL
jgi:hypothetical protein